MIVVARSARLCAVTDPLSEQYRAAVGSAERCLSRAQSYYEEFRGSHLPTERQVRVVLTALVEARAVLTVLMSTLPREGEDLERLAAKVERAVARAEAQPTV